MFSDADQSRLQAVVIELARRGVNVRAQQLDRAVGDGAL